MGSSPTGVATAAVPQAKISTRRPAQTAEENAVATWSTTVVEEREAPRPYFGNYPNGSYWLAVPLGEEPDVDDDHTVDGSHLRIMWDESAGPLWGVDGLLPDDPIWLQRALGISESLIADLLGWQRDMDVLNHRPSTDEWRARQQELDVRAGQLAARLQAEVGTRYEVQYRA
ncbi:hypothetical protein [Nocardioides bizhenqiangii]|uniref:Uncharacterized protein n=1 Tax=Nocardioides bizhenqiangii TaxID=3095076 RepID=A0ABZ0ZUI3_9ACTN|nr:hypothetical protein [Nocardioides sp. HM61]WQQ27984.1 hypothetical protein SHK19_07040 [Nocardioides sp. HM61]